MSQTAKEHEAGAGGWKSWLRMLIIILLLWVGFGFFSVLRAGYGGMTPAELGDSFGALNTLFAGLALGALILTLRMQHSEMTAMVAAANEQASNMDKQIREARIFQMLELRNRLIEGFEHCYPNAETPTIGAMAAEKIVARGMDALGSGIETTHLPYKFLMQMGYVQAFDLMSDAVEVAQSLDDPGRLAILSVIKNQVTVTELACTGFLQAEWQGSPELTDKRLATLDLLAPVNRLPTQNATDNVK